VRPWEILREQERQDWQRRGWRCLLQAARRVRDQLDAQDRELLGVLIALGPHHDHRPMRDLLLRAQTTRTACA
jgi:hypothetical protein